MAHVERFTDRVSNYSRFRPSYPESLIASLADFGLARGANVADIGSGTGILTELLLAAGTEVFAVEPNEPMRREAEARLGGSPGFHSIAASAESTSLPDRSMDLITAAQAFHWFDASETRREWARILKPGGWVALIWNERDDSTEVGKSYGALANAFVEQQEARRRLAQPTATIAEFFAPYEVKRLALKNHQDLDLDGLIGRAMSSSYWPKSGPDFEKSLQKLKSIFESHAQSGLVRINYVTEVFLGQLT